MLKLYSERIFAGIPKLSLRDFQEGDPRIIFSERLRKIVKAHNAPELHREMYSILHEDPDIGVLMREWQIEVVARFYESLNQARSLLRIEDLKTAAVLLTSIIEALVQKILDDILEEDEKDRLIEESADMLICYILRED